MSGVFSTLFQGAAIGGLAIAASIDVKTRLIPDELALWVGVLGLASRVLADGWQSWLSVLVAACVVVPLGALSHRDILGGGDAKMIAAVTMVFTPALVPRLLLMIALAGGVLSVGYLIAYVLIKPSAPGLARLQPAHPDLLAAERARIAAREPLPYGVAILTGATGLLVREVMRF